VENHEQETPKEHEQETPKEHEQAFKRAAELHGEVKKFIEEHGEAVGSAFEEQQELLAVTLGALITDMPNAETANEIISVCMAEFTIGFRAGYQHAIKNEGRC